MLHDRDRRHDDREPSHREDAPPHIFAWDSPRPYAGRPCARLGQDAPQAHRSGNVLHFLLACVFIAQREFVSYLLMHSTRDADAAWFGETLETRRDVDAVAVDLLALDHNVAEVDADAEFHPAFERNRDVFGFERGLDLDRALDRIHDAGELREHAVTGGVDEPAAMLLDEGVNDFAIRGKCLQRRLLIFPHEAAVAVDVGAEYGGELALH
jgi:hypothetical protein